MPKRGGGLGQFANLRGWAGVGKKDGVRGRGSDTPMHTMNLAITLTVIFNLLIPMSLLLISNKKKYYLATDWLLI